MIRLIDYYRRGCWEGRDPSPRFVTDWYFAQHPEVAGAGMCPLEHFLRVGAAAGLAPAPSAPSGPTVAPGSARSLTPSLTRRDRPQADPRRERPESASASPTPVASVSPARADIRAIRKLIAERVPEDVRLGVVTDGRDELLKLSGSTGTPVPRAPDGERASDPPRNVISAVAHIESLRAAQVDMLLAPDPCLWLTAVPGLVGYLDDRYERIGRPGVAFLWDVRSPRPATAGRTEGVGDALERMRQGNSSEPSVLDWDSGIDLRRMAPSVTVFSPRTTTGRTLDYADDSIDAVIYRAGVSREAEARRVARTVVIGTSADGADADVEWLTDASGLTASASVVIPTYADVDMLSACLRSLDETTSHRLEVEFVVADDGSDGVVLQALEELVAAYPRARLVHNEHNGGYIAAAMAGAAAAGNDILVLLNNDTVLLPGWLEALLDTFVQHPEAGVVGGMLLYPDGRLQEAGGAIFADGSATKIGYGDTDPSLPYYAHLREVDYVSGALLATPRALFEELGGLDSAYGFGYYEDDDYCFKVRQSGRAVLYQPLSRVVHVEGGTAGMDLTHGPKAFQARNQAIFMERWRDELRSQPVRPEPLDLYASRDLVVRGRGGRGVE